MLGYCLILLLLGYAILDSRSDMPFYRSDAQYLLLCAAKQRHAGLVPALFSTFATLFGISVFLAHFCCDKNWSRDRYFEKKKQFFWSPKNHFSQTKIAQKSTQKSPQKSQGQPSDSRSAVFGAIFGQKSKDLKRAF